MTNQNHMEFAIDEILKSTKYIIKEELRHITQIYDGIVLSNNNDGRWNVRYNGEVHAVKPYKITPNVNDMVKIIIPQGNQALAFFI